VKKVLTRSARRDSYPTQKWSGPSMVWQSLGSGSVSQKLRNWLEGVKSSLLPQMSSFGFRQAARQVKSNRGRGGEIAASTFTWGLATQVEKAKPAPAE